ncbi:hypothetical protein [Variovorax sp. LG9.2]|uniref:hypothetical protein n=1 Tax=Variovorax sp. LG9.2 TaxID=3048626 RepID=UPI002B22F908|nr:hypothetical protein [Variovorax sp. LG9.2]
MKARSKVVREKVEKAHQLRHYKQAKGAGLPEPQHAPQPNTCLQVDPVDTRHELKD